QPKMSLAHNKRRHLTRVTVPNVWYSYSGESITTAGLYRPAAVDVLGHYQCRIISGWSRQLHPLYRPARIARPITHHTTTRSVDYQRLPFGAVWPAVRHRHTRGQNWSPPDVHDRCHDFWYRLPDCRILTHGMVLSSRPRASGCWSGHHDARQSGIGTHYLLRCPRTQCGHCAVDVHRRCRRRSRTHHGWAALRILLVALSSSYQRTHRERHCLCQHCRGTAQYYYPDQTVGSDLLDLGHVYHARRGYGHQR